MRPTALVVVGIAGGSFSALDHIKAIDGLGRALDAMVNLIAVFMVPAAVINAVRVVVELARRNGVCPSEPRYGNQPRPTAWRQTRL